MSNTKTDYESGCYVDGDLHGHYTCAKVILFAVDAGWDDEIGQDAAEEYMADSANDPELNATIVDMTIGQAVEWLNENRCPSRHYWEFRESLFLFELDENE